MKKYMRYGLGTEMRENVSFLTPYGRNVNRLSLRRHIGNFLDVLGGKVFSSVLTFL